MSSTLIHEIWFNPEDDGQMLPGLCLAGPMGDDYRKMLNPGAKKSGTIEGTSHYDVMTKYYRLMGWGTYSTTFVKDREPYPSHWIAIQRRFLEHND